AAHRQPRQTLIADQARGDWPRHRRDRQRADLMPSTAQRAVSEIIGTAFLLAALIGSGIMAQRLAGGNAALALLCNTLPTGAILVVLILIFGPVSGGHLNPAVSLVAALRHDLSWRDAAAYVAAQLCGGLIGVWTAHLMFELPVW